MKKSNDTIGNRTRDLPACSAVPQPTVPHSTVPEQTTATVDAEMLHSDRSMIVMAF